MEVYFIGEFAQRALDYFAENNLEYPNKGTLYTIDRVIIRNDNYCLILNEIKNPYGFPYYLFTDVPDNVLNWETVNEIFKQCQILRVLKLF